MGFNHPLAIFIVLIIFMTILSLMYEYDLDVRDIVGYILVAAAVCSVFILVPATGFYMIMKIRNFAQRISGDNSRNLGSEAVSTTSDRPTNNLPNTSILNFLNRLYNLPDFTLKTLPTYNRAMENSRPFRVNTDEEGSLPPPSYRTLPGSRFNQMPPPVYEAEPSAGINPSS